MFPVTVHLWLLLFAGCLLDCLLQSMPSGALKQGHNRHLEEKFVTVFCCDTVDM